MMPISENVILGKGMLVFYIPTVCQALRYTVYFITTPLKAGASSTRILLTYFPVGALSYEKTKTGLICWNFLNLGGLCRVPFHRGSGQGNVTSGI